MRHDLRSRWWPIPGMVAILASLAVVATTQGWLRASPVEMPRTVQVGVRVEASAHPASSPPVAVNVPATVVSPSRPVIADPAVTPVSSDTAVTDRLVPPAPSAGTTTNPARPSAPSSEDFSPAAASGTDVTTTTAAPTTTTAPTGGVTTTTQPRDE